MQLTDEQQRFIDEHYQLLPKDADGEAIHIGDRVEDNERVVRIVLTDGSREPSVYVERLPSVLHEYFCNEISHYHEPTVEDVLTKMLEQAVGYSGWTPRVRAAAIGYPWMSPARWLTSSITSGRTATKAR